MIDCQCIVLDAYGWSNLQTKRIASIANRTGYRSWCQGCRICCVGPCLAQSSVVKRRKREGCHQTLTDNLILFIVMVSWCHVACISSRFDAIQFQCLRCTTTGWEISIAGASCWEMDMKKTFADQSFQWSACCFCVCSFAGEGSSIGLGIHFRGVASFGPQYVHVDFFCRREKHQNIERIWNFCPETIWSTDGTYLVQCLMQLEKI